MSVVGHPVTNAVHEVIRSVRQDPGLSRVSDVLLARGGNIVVHETFGDHAAGDAHDLFSVTKTVLALVTGIAVERGHVALDDPVTAATRLAPHPGLASVTVRHLLTMTRGAAAEGQFDLDRVAVSGLNWASRFADAPQLDPPGTRFRYDNGASQLLAELLHHVVGDLAAYTNEMVFAPLGIDEWSWVRDPTGVPSGAGHLSMSAPSLARLGSVLCREGRSRDGLRIVDGGWVRAMRTVTSRGGAPEGLPYGMGLWVEGRHVCFGAGWAGQLLWCRPAEDIVVVTLSDPGFDYGPPARDEMPPDWKAPLEVLRRALG